VTDYSTYRFPGKLIEELLEARGWSQRVLAIVLDADETGINKIVQGKRPLDAKMALALFDLFKVPAEVFLEIQKTYELAQARIMIAPDPGRSERAHLFGDLPISDMIKRGWLDVDDVREVPKVEAALLKFFGAASTAEIEILPHAAKKTKASSEPTHAQLAWLYRVNQIANEMIAVPYTEALGRAAVAKLRPLLVSADSIRKVPRILAECGIRFAIIESLPRAKIDGACLWLDDYKPVIALSMRYDRIDNFWFVLRHEIEHVLRKHGRSGPMLDVELEGDRAGVGDSLSEEERVANEAAAEFCVPKKTLKAFIARKSPLFPERDVLALARMTEVHPGVVAGQLRHATGRFELFSQHLIKVRSIIAPSALIDGWGDVVPVDK